jgi:invasion protein IalB
LLTLQVYCGGCARQRYVKSGSKKEKRPDHFKTCVVDGCGARVDSKAAMIQVYL